MSAPRPYADIADHLKSLANPARLEILHVLRTPRALHEIRLTPSLTVEGQRPERPMSRQAVAKHLDQLQEGGLLRRLPSEGGSDRYVLNREKLFALVDEMRRLTRLRPVALNDVPVDATLPQGDGADRPLPEGPRLLVSYGPEDGLAFSLASGGPQWTLGRAPECDIPLDHDPFLSAKNCLIEEGDDGFVLRDLNSRNGTVVNFAPLGRGEKRQLVPGDLIIVGRTHLVFQHVA